MTLWERIKNFINNPGDYDSSDVSSDDSGDDGSDGDD